MNKFDDPLDAIEEIIKKNKRSTKCIKLITDTVLYQLVESDAKQFISDMIDRAYLHNKLWSVFHLQEITKYLELELYITYGEKGSTVWTKTSKK
jgi:hypothetical protein